MPTPVTPPMMTAISQVTATLELMTEVIRSAAAIRRPTRATSMLAREPAFNHWSEAECSSLKKTRTAMVACSPMRGYVATRPTRRMRQRYRQGTDWAASLHPG